MTAFYTGQTVSKEFMKRWRSKKHVGNYSPFAEVLVRRGRFERRFHNNWPNPQFGQVVGRSIRKQWYADWTPLDDWTPLPGVAKIDLNQSFDQNGVAVATLDVDNLDFQRAVGPGGDSYHLRERGFLWPWRGYVPAHRPGSGEHRNSWYNRLPNAQILVRQGYGDDTAVKTFTGLVDTINGSVRPDRVVLTARDFGGVLVDSYVFGWNKDKTINDPITFVPHGYDRLQLLKTGKIHRWIIIKDAVDIIKCCLRWCGFKEWQIEDSGVNLAQPYTIDKSKSFMDVINDIKAQLGYVFFIGEPSDDDLSIGVPIFRASSSLVPNRSKPLTIRDSDLLTDMKPTHDNSNDRYIIRVRGQIAPRKKGGRPLAGDSTLRVTFTYWPPWMSKMAGVIKQLTYYNIGDKSSVGFQTVADCEVACVLIATQIALSRDTAIGQTPGLPAVGLDSFVYVIDSGTGVTSRLYVANRKSTQVIGGDGSSKVNTSSTAGTANPLWVTEFGGSLVDNPEFDHIRKDYDKAIHHRRVLSGGTKV